ncbi:Hypothetical protein ACI5QL_03097 [Bacillus velezensis]
MKRNLPANKESACHKRADSFFLYFSRKINYYEIMEKKHIF